MLLSIITIAVNNLVLAERFLASLLGQSVKNFTVFLVVSPNIPEKALEKLRKDFSDLTITFLRSQDFCLSRSRNLALAHVDGDIVAIADDDCAYESDTVAQIIAAFENHKGAGAVMGRAFGFDEELSPGGHVLTLNRFNVFKNCPSYVHFYRTNVIKSVGMFDESLGVGSGTPFQSGEETDYALRAIEAGFTILRVPSIIIRHPIVALRNKFILDKTTCYAAGRMRLLHKHNFPCWFLLANVFYPLLCFPLDCLEECCLVIRYRWTMFLARLQWLIKAK